MPRAKIDHVYIAEGLAEDCEELMLKCSQVSKLSYEKFCDIWKELDFSCIFHCRRTGAELAEFSEEALHVAKHFMVSYMEDYEKSVAGLFLVYAILNLQPYSGFAALKLVQDDVPAIKKLELVARKERRIDILYILGEVLVRGPCQYHVAARERGLDFCLRKYFDGYIQHAFIGQKPLTVFRRQNEEINIMKSISVEEKQYHNEKPNIPDQEPSLQYVNPNQAVELQLSLKRVVSGVIEGVKEPISVAPVKTTTTTEPESESLAYHHDNVQSIKMKALKNVVNPMRHLTGVQERASEPVPSTSKTKTPPKSTKDTTKSRRKSDTPEQLKSPTKYPWTIKPLFNDSDDETIKASSEDTSSQDMVQIDLDPIDDQSDDQNNTASKSKKSKKDSQNNKESDKDNQSVTEPNVSNNKRKRSPKKNASPRKLSKLSVYKARNSKLDLSEPKHNVTKSLKRNNAQKDSCQFIDISIDRIPQEVSVNNNVEFEIIDQFTSRNNRESKVKPSTSKDKKTNKDKVTSKEKSPNKQRMTSKDKAPSKDKAASEEKVTSEQKVTSKDKSPNEEKVTSIRKTSSKNKLSCVEKVTSKEKVKSKNKASREEKVTSKRKETSEEIVRPKKRKLKNRVGNSKIKRLGIAQFEDFEIDSD